MPCRGIYAVVVAAGKGERMGAGVNKVYLPISSRSALLRSLDAFADKCVDGVVIVAAEGDMKRCWDEVNQTKANVLSVVTGGATRLHSVKNGLDALPTDARVVLIHDAARPFVSSKTINACVDAAFKYGSGVAATTLTDTIRQVNEDGLVTGLPDRATLRAVQTPQCFRADWLRIAYDRAVREGWETTDDIGVIVRAGYTTHVVETEPGNIKITTPDDLRYARILTGISYRIGQGYDAHKLIAGRKLILCGVDVPYDKGLLGHSDADVAVHALMDAILGAACLGDIGMLYPDSNEQYRDISSLLLLGDTNKRIHERGLRLANADIIIIAQMPKLAPYRDAMRDNIIRTTGCMNINVKMTTTEGMGFEGRSEGIAAMASVLLETDA